MLVKEMRSLGLNVELSSLDTGEDDDDWAADRGGITEPGGLQRPPAPPPQNFTRKGLEK